MTDPAPRQPGRAGRTARRAPGGHRRRGWHARPAAGAGVPRRGAGRDRAAGRADRGVRRRGRLGPGQPAARRAGQRDRGRGRGGLGPQQQLGRGRPRPVLDLAARTGADVQIRDQAGQAVASSPGFAGHGRPAARACRSSSAASGSGTAVVRFTGSGPRRRRPQPADRAAAGHRRGGRAGRAARAADRPAPWPGGSPARSIRLIAVTRAMGGGGPRRPGRRRSTAPGELRELATAFDQMADTLDRQEQLRRDLVADVAHELRTPIAILQAGHEALLDGVAEPTPAELASLRDEVLRLARMVDDLQTLAAADAAALQLSLQPLRPGRGRRGRGRQPGRPVRGGRLTLDRQLAPARCLADPRWLHQVITNLLTNALKFTPAGGRVTISTERTGADAVLRVTDTGAGHPRRRAAAHLRPVLARPAGRPDLRQRHRPGRRGRAGPGPRRPADRGQRARPRHPDDAHPAFGLASAFLHIVPIAASPRLRSARLCCEFKQRRRRPTNENDTAGAPRGPGHGGGAGDRRRRRRDRRGRG